MGFDGIPIETHEARPPDREDAWRDRLEQAVLCREAVRLLGW